MERLPPPVMNGGAAGQPQQQRFSSLPSLRPLGGFQSPQPPPSMTLKPSTNVVPPPGPPRLDGSLMNGPPSALPPRVSLGGNFRPLFVNGQPGQLSGPPARPPTGPAQRSVVGHLVPPNVSPAGPPLKPPLGSGPVTTSSSPLINGHQRPSPPTNLPAPSGSLTNLNEGFCPPTSRSQSSSSLVDESAKISPRMSPRMSPITTTTVSGQSLPVNGTPVSMSLSSEPSVSGTPVSNMPLNRTVGSPFQSSGQVANQTQVHLSDSVSSHSNSSPSTVQSSVSGHISMASSNVPSLSRRPISGSSVSGNHLSSASGTVPGKITHTAKPTSGPQSGVPSVSGTQHFIQKGSVGPSLAAQTHLATSTVPSSSVAASVASFAASNSPLVAQHSAVASVALSPSVGARPAVSAPMSNNIRRSVGPLPPSVGPPLASMGPQRSFGPPSTMDYRLTSLGPPQTSMGSPQMLMGPPQTSMGPPMLTSMGAPRPSLGPPPTSMGPPPTSMGPPPTSMGPPPASMGPLPTSMGPPPASMGPLPTSMGPPPTSMGPPPTSMGPPTLMGPPTSMGYRPTGVPPPMSTQGTAQPGSFPQYPGQQQQFQPQFRPSGPPNVTQLSQQLGGLSVTRDGWNKIWGTHPLDLLQQRQVLPPEGVVPPKPVLAQDYLPNCSPDIFRCTLTKIPETKSVLQKARLPFGMLIHPFKDLEHLPVVSCNTIVRCRSCRTYINPFVVFKGERRWECNLCFRVNELPEEFQYDPVSRTYGDPSRRPEVREATIEFIAPQEYMLRPPQPATYLWVLDVSRQAVDTGYLKIVCDVLLAHLDKIPGDRRIMIGFITFSNSVQFYLMGEDQKHVQMLEVGEIEEMFVPNPEDLLVNLEQSHSLVEDFLSTLPEAHAATFQTQSALGPALQAAYKLMSPIGGRITLMTTTLPSVGPGALKAREDPNQRAGKDIQNMGPATDFYKKLSLDCSGQQIAVDLFTLNSQYVDLATLTGVSKFSGGCIHHFPNFHVTRNPASVNPFMSCLTRYITRKIGFEAVMRIRATRGLAITNFHGNFFVRSTDLLSLPNINPDAGFGMQVNIEESLHNIRTACFQAALLYTSSKGERRIRVHTLCLPVSPNMHEVITAVDQQAVIGLLAKMAVDRCLSSSLSDARDALINACVDGLTAFKISLSSPAHGALEVPPTLQLLPLYTLALVKSIAFRGGLSTKLDDRLFAMCELKTLPLKHLITFIYPDLYPIHMLSEKGALNVDDQVIPQPGRLHLSAERLERCGAYLMDTGTTIYIYVRSGISSNWVEGTLGVPSYAVIPQPLYEDALPVLDTMDSQLLCNFVSHLQRNKPYHAPVLVLKEDNPARMMFIQHLVDDRTESSHSYIEFLQFLKTQIK
ncbi:hypothetical protein OTU49_010755 [Cherax quadricarinatus]|uniref:Protein transport protein Sec24A n=1 Tax=Cherax quadricarinatus TaxID=27406 RepID=A0AAW0W814_CHEQU